MVKKIDYKYWASLDKWTQKEAALLIDGKDPDEHRSVRLTFTSPPEGYESAARIAKAISRTDWTQRYGSGSYWVSTSPLYIVDALVGAGWSVPEELQNEIAARVRRDPALQVNDADHNQDAGGNRPEPDGEPEIRSTSSASSRERTTMLKLILGLACGGYGMDPDEPKNKHAKGMREDLERFGMPLDDGTIKKYLDEAREYRRKLIASQQRG